MNWIWSAVPKSKFISIMRWHKMYGCPIAVYYDFENNPTFPWKDRSKNHLWPEEAFVEGVYAEISAPITSVFQNPTAEA